MIVVARYTEDLSWLKKVKPPSIVYNKGDDCVKDAIPLENKGREGDTFLTYILRHYNHLNELTFFIQGNPLEHYPMMVEFLNAKEIKCPMYLPLGDIHVNNGKGLPHDLGDLRVSDTHIRIFGEDRDLYLFVAGAQYVVNRNYIKNKPYEWWLGLYDIYNNTEKNAWVFERLWPYIWEHKARKLL